MKLTFPQVPGLRLFLTAFPMPSKGDGLAVINGYRGYIHDGETGCAAPQAQEVILFSMKMKHAISTYPEGQVPSLRFIRHAATLVAFLLLTPVSNSVEIPEADPRLVELDLVAPENDLIKGESLRYQVVLRNLGSQPVPIAVPYEHFGLRLLSGCQLFLRPFYRGSGPNPFSQGRPLQLFSRKMPMKVEEAPWPPTDFDDGEPARSVVWLPPGQKISWSEMYISEGDFGILAYPELVAVRAQWLIGPGKWIESPKLSVAVREFGILAGEVVFEEKLRPPVSQSGIVAKLTKVPIDDKSYLFYTGPSHIRLCEVGTREKVQAFVDEKTCQLMVSFPESTRPPVYVQLVWGGVSSSPWPIMPPDGLMPEPRPQSMSKEEILAARKRLSLASDGPADPAVSPVAEKSAGAVGLARTEAESSGTSERHLIRNVVLWLASAAVLLAFAAVLLRMRRKRRPKS